MVCHSSPNTHKNNCCWVGVFKKPTNTFGMPWYCHSPPNTQIHKLVVVCFNTITKIKCISMWCCAKSKPQKQNLVAYVFRKHKPKLNGHYVFENLILLTYICLCSKPNRMRIRCSFIAFPNYTYNTIYTYIVSYTYM